MWAALFTGDRPYFLALIGLLGLIVAMALGPLQIFTAATDRVDDLEGQRDELREDVDGLEDRKRRLQDPEEIELHARSELGLVRPGEIPFVVAIPEDEEDAGDDADGEDSGSEDAWYLRLGRWLSDRLTVDDD